MRRHPRGTGLAGKSASIQPPQPPSEERGVELIGGKAIPFVRNLVSADYWTVTYGSHDAGDAARVRKEKIRGRSGQCTAQRGSWGMSDAVHQHGRSRTMATMPLAEE